MSLAPFKNTLEKLENIITKLETNTGSAHKVSQVDELLNRKVNVVLAPVVEVQKIEQKPEIVQVQIVKVEQVQSIKQETKIQPKVQVQKVQQPKTVIQKAQNKEAVIEKKQQEKVVQPVQQKKQKKQKTEKKVEVKKQQKKEQKEQKQQEATIEDFAQIDIRIGYIRQCWKHPASENLYCEKIDIGEEAVREIASGLQKYVPIENMSGPVLVMANLKARKLADFMSNGMIMANSNIEHTHVQLIIPEGKIGERVSIQGFEDKIKQDRQPVLNPKKKILEKCLPKFKASEDGFAEWNGHKLKTSGGYIRCGIPGGSIS